MKKSYDAEALAISIIHELAHQELFLINLVDRLIRSDVDFRLAHAPYQNKPRPPIGRFHSAHALFRMIQLEESISPESAERHQLLLAQTVETFLPNEVTDYGRTILNEVY